MKKNTTITFLILLSIIVSSNIYAEESTAEVEKETETNVSTQQPTTTPPPRPMPQRPVREDVRERTEVKRNEIQDVRRKAAEDIRMKRQENQQDIRQIRADFKAELKDKKGTSTGAFKEKRAELIKAVQEKRDIFKTELQTKRGVVASSTANIRAKFKSDLEKIKDENKRVRVENAGNNLMELNTKITTKSSERVDKIEEVLISLESRADKSALEGLNMTGVITNITMSENIVAQARLAISNQAAKTYSVTITDEATAKASLQASRDLLKKDIEAMNMKIKAAHDSVRKSVETFKVIAKVNATTTAPLNN